MIKIDRDIREGDFYTFKGYGETKFIYTDEKTLTDVPIIIANTDDYLELLWRNDIKVDIMAMAVCIFEFDIKTIKYKSLSGFPIVDSIHTALKLACEWCDENGYLKQEASK